MVNTKPSTATPPAARLALAKNAFELLRSGLANIEVTRVPESSMTELLSFLDVLYEWNLKMNLTSIVGLEGITTHLVDSLAMARLATFTGKERLVDIGSGAGIPGIPLGLAFPSLSVTLVESISKKVTFQQHAVDDLGMENVSPRQGRAEVLARERDLHRSFDIATARAVGSLADLCKWSAPFLKDDGCLIAYKGKAEALDEVPAGWEVVGKDQFLLNEKQRTLLTLKKKRS